MFQILALFIYLVHYDKVIIPIILSLTPVQC